ncbi:MAG: LOG family protein [Chloroflexi bacterium]|nr:LOG family protein [Chloroflexota bacterium]MDA1226347.1 LOG family protein [Chloroflexota bacterium]
MTEMKLDTLEGVLQEVEKIFEAEGVDIRNRLYKELIVDALKFKRDNLDTLDLKIANRSMAEFRYAARVFKPYRGFRKVSIFGSARTPEDDPYYALAVDFARRLVQEHFMVITGAASGIMKAGNVGAGAEQSFGANILLPFEQGANEVIVDDPKLITFRYFFTRKLFFLMEAHGVALFPGGFGTHDEGMETLTLIQTGKAPPMPLVLMELPGEDYWESWDQFIRKQLLGRGLIAEDDLCLYKIVHSAEDGVAWMKHYYSTYNSMRRVRDRLVIRLEKQLTNEHVEELNETFGGLLKKGTIKKTKALAQEADQPELLEKPRLAFNYNDRHAGRLNLMVQTINEMGLSISGKSESD